MSGRLRFWPSRKSITCDRLFCLVRLSVDLQGNQYLVNNDFVLRRLRLWSSRIFTTVTVSLLLNLPSSPSSTFQDVKNKCSIILFSYTCVLNHPAVSWERRATETDSLLKNYVLQKFFFMISLHSSSRSHGRQFIIREYLSTPDLSWIISLRFLIRWNLIPIIYFFASSSLFVVSIPDDFF